MRGTQKSNVYSHNSLKDGRSPPTLLSHQAPSATHVRSASSVTSPVPKMVSHVRSDSASGTGTQFGVFTPQNYLGKSRTLPASLNVRSGSTPVSPLGPNPPSISAYNSRAEAMSSGRNSNGFGVPHMSHRSHSTVPQDMARPAQSGHRNLQTGSRYPAAKSGYL